MLYRMSASHPETMVKVELDKVLPKTGEDVRSCLSSDNGFLHTEAAPGISWSTELLGNVKIATQNLASVQKKHREEMNDPAVKANLDRWGMFAKEVPVSGPWGIKTIPDEQPVDVVSLFYKDTFSPPTDWFKFTLPSGAEIEIDLNVVRHGTTYGGPTTEVKLNELKSSIEGSLGDEVKDGLLKAWQNFINLYPEFHEEGEDNRVFQGFVQALMNNSDGKELLNAVADQLTEHIKDRPLHLVVTSPLARAYQIVSLALKEGGCLEKVPAIIDQQLGEISFGRCDGWPVELFGTGLPGDDRPFSEARLFNLEALFARGEDGIDANGFYKKGQSMYDMMLQVEAFMKALPDMIKEQVGIDKLEQLAKEGEKVGVELAAHSMTLASLNLLIGKGYTSDAYKQDGNVYLGSKENRCCWDGKSAPAQGKQVTGLRLPNGKDYPAAPTALSDRPQPF